MTSIEGGFVALTPLDRMEQMWEQIHKRDDVMLRVTGYSPVMNKRSEVAFVETFDALVAEVERLRAGRDDPSMDLENVNAAFMQQFERANVAEREVERLRAAIVRHQMDSKLDRSCDAVLYATLEAADPAAQVVHMPEAVTGVHTCSEWCHCPSEDT